MSPRPYPTISGRELIQRLEQAYGYRKIRQRGSHIRIRTMRKGKHSLTIPDHKELDVGTLNGIINAVARHFGVDKQDVIAKLFK